MLAALILIPALGAQERTDSPDPGGIFPLALLLERAQYAADAGAWRPDWPLELPPDSFKVPGGELSRASIDGEGYLLNMTFGPSGLIEEFPFILNGMMSQVSLAYNDMMEIKELTIAFPSREDQGQEDAWNIEFLEHEDSFPILARAFRQNTWSFVYIVWGVNDIRETWYDVDGNFLGAYSFSYVNIGKNRRIRAVKDFSSPYEETFHFDSRGLITEHRGAYGLYGVIYFREDLPRFWERRPASDDSAGTGHFSLQWDANGILLRISSNAGESTANADAPVNFRYEYSFDEKGNWVRRQELRMIQNLDHFIPTPGTVFNRVLEYREPQ